LISPPLPSQGSLGLCSDAAPSHPIYISIVKMKIFAAAFVACVALVNVVGAAELLGTYTLGSTAPGPVKATQTGVGADAYAPYSTPRPSTSPEGPYVQCYVKLQSQKDTMVEVPTPDGITTASETTPKNVMCYRVTVTGGGILRIPIPHESDTNSTAVMTELPSNVGLTIILPVVVSVVAAALLFLTIFLVRRKRASRAAAKRESKGVWAKRFGWVSSDVESQREVPVISKPLPQLNPTTDKY